MLAVRANWALEIKYNFLFPHGQGYERIHLNGWFGVMVKTPASPSAVTGILSPPPLLLLPFRLSLAKSLEAKAAVAKKYFVALNKLDNFQGDIASTSVKTKRKSTHVKQCYSYLNVAIYNGTNETSNEYFLWSVCLKIITILIQLSKKLLLTINQIFQIPSII